MLLEIQNYNYGWDGLFSHGILVLETGCLKNKKCCFSRISVGMAVPFREVFLLPVTCNFRPVLPELPFVQPSLAYPEASHHIWDINTPCKYTALWGEHWGEEKPVEKFWAETGPEVHSNSSFEGCTNSFLLHQLPLSNKSSKQGYFGIDLFYPNPLKSLGV